MQCVSTALLSFAGLATLSACVSGAGTISSAPDREFERVAVFHADDGGSPILLNLGEMTISRNGHTTRVEDCSNEEFYCLTGGEWFSFSYPKVCPPREILANRGWTAGGFPIRYRAPNPHRPVGSGLYFRPGSPESASFIYDPEFGLIGLEFANVPPDHPDWGNPGVEETRYSRGDLGNKNMSGLFKCAPQETRP